jgi:glucose/arabinose dehydrogenase
MNTTTSIALLACLAVTTSGSAQPQPLKDPIPEKIPKGDIVVAVRDFVRLPKTEDSAKPQSATNAYARIQYLIPARDGTGRLFVNATGREPQVYLDLRRQDVGFDDSFFPNESGLAGFAFHPDFARKGRPGYGKLYTAYSTPSHIGKADYLDDDAGSHESVVREWAATDPAAGAFAGTSREILRVGQFAPTHNVGTIAFNPNARDGSPDFGLLYITFGDGGASNDPHNNGQNLAEPLGAILRIDPLKPGANRRYGIPPDNPFAKKPGAAPEIWAYGLRHPQHISWDTAGEGRILIAEYGQSQVDEVNIGVAGGNYGWQLREGTFATGFAVKGDKDDHRVYPRPPDDQHTAGLLDPVAQYDHDEGKGISSGFVYRGGRVPELQGKYVFSDIVSGRLFYVDADKLTQGKQAELKELRLLIGGQEKPLIDLVGYPNTYARGTLRADLRLGVDDAGELYLLTKGDGWVRTLDAAK